jgi:hypothetical protein
MIHYVLLAILQQFHDVGPECVTVFQNRIHYAVELTGADFFIGRKEIRAEFYGNGAHLRVNVVDAAF